MKEIFSLTEREFELIKITLRILGKFCKFDILKIYETDRHFEIHTANNSENFFTKTIINKLFWTVIECYYHKVGEPEIKLQYNAKKKKRPVAY